MLSPQISIIVPCYNQAQYLDECLQSVASQTFRDWECLIIDDGSPDYTAEVAKKWIESDSRFTYYKKENGGVASARNFGLEKVSGKWILPLDGDDKINENYLSYALEKLREGYDLVYCHADYFGTRNEPFILLDYTFENLLKYNVIFCSALFSREKLNDIRYDENMIHGLEDWEFWISYLSQPDMKVYRLEETLFYYRIKDISRNENIKNDSEKMDEAKKYILEKHSKTYVGIFGDYFHLIWKVSALERENNYYNRIISSKKYKIINRVINFIHKIQP
ncbi:MULTISPECIES: glycosyltransferase family 2 protein [Chryseobacterium]|uniref:Glycosyltransferase involved in cell wall biosynthesis n=1 Tax=Chryseobacterium camelliae TaxID=1265445 RepID=A0ABU0TNA4_9FLAO|nr:MULTISPECIES: glycosyltransferase family 2 protein [Chryseobacterium]MDT3407613.1 glycosyltransferase involved in cell wall biosynthesis [Pseudacidovorax intermedius]MDQ1098535.1 glycosyltransferase involved in cell wall biosynthesis [Chryseobacterium camelliae]MDQ1102459.1 glycosyltransferase involved in cell wall biosynthesis [Chryseobacterium sp. SORGH_AS_1048]MDR6085892.1 glycosyltransferase involved in cell wall biosynthesis [Chryseobacterium sp. SORGH_AS_0909]MDR6130259.1 glycosyltran